MQNAVRFYDFGCNYFNANGMPDMRKAVNKELFGKEGFDFRLVGKIAIEKQLDIYNEENKH
jgi:hypothetical protein